LKIKALYRERAQNPAMREPLTKKAARFREFVKNECL
jgi:hypothetical protein